MRRSRTTAGLAIAITAAMGIALGVASVMAACGGKIDPLAVDAGHGHVDDGGDGTAARMQTLRDFSDAVASAYCGAFASCCAADGETVDVARCESYTSDALYNALHRVRRHAASGIAACADAVRARAETCPSDDAAWPKYGGSTPALFLPTPVYRVCASLVGGQPDEAAPSCDGGGCADGGSCEVDTCVDVGQLGGKCPSLECVDTAVCGADGTCEPRTPKPNGAPCDGTCDPGLVCAFDKCAPARDHPEVPYVERASPYSVRPETCMRFSYL